MSITGHRWHKLPFGTNEDDPRCKTLVQNINGILTQKFDEGISRNLRHGAWFGTLVAEAVIRLQQSGYNLSMLSALLST
jgi:hypothetical protein